jgi:hypothetical protein
MPLYTMNIEVAYTAAMILIGVLVAANILFQLGRILWTGRLPSTRTPTDSSSSFETSDGGGDAD